ncbi:MAG: flagellar biosynthesis anti-sigma factor FlgM [Planctomycetota bacterium]
MTNISPTSTGSLGRIEVSASLAATTREAGEAPARRGVRSTDRVEVSDMARLLAKMNDMPDIRADLVSKVRGEIASGKYENEEKLELAIDAMLEDTRGL